MLPAPANNNVKRFHLDSSSKHSATTTTSTTAANTQQQQHQLQFQQQQQQSQEPQYQLQQQLQELQQQRTNKRSASMIFRIEHLLPTANAMRRTPPAASTYAATATSNGASTTTATQKRSTKQRSPRTGVYVAQFTPKDTISESLATYMLMNSGCGNGGFDTENGSGSSSPVPSANNACCTLVQGMLRLNPALFRRIKLSEDIHSYNALFELNGAAVRVRVVRDIARDEELVAWFGEQTSLLMAIPFLTPLNIQGNKHYTCHLCHLSFETPNPLKIHLALGCGRHSMDILWIRLHYAVKANAYTQQQQQLQLQQQERLQQQQARLSITPPGLNAPLSSTPAPSSSASSSISPGTSPHSRSRTAVQQQLHQQSHSQQHTPPISTHSHAPRFSAFKPVSPSIVFTSTTSATTTTSAHRLTALHTSTPPLTFLPPAPMPHLGGLLQPAAAAALNPLNAAAQIEAIVSNMGASKQGHLCIYCGKVYSRKYGLKIHIRTHTGFKPLKCKFCLRPFGDPSNLNKHVRLHLQSNASTATIEGYKCTLCNKTLARRRDLQRHMESRHAESTTTTADT